MYDFDQIQNRRGTASIKWDRQYSFGVESGLLPFWIADTDFASVPEVLNAIKKRCDHPIIGYSDFEENCLISINKWYTRRHGWDIPISYMLPSSGVVTSLYFSIQALTEERDKVLVFTPVYDPFFAIIKNTKRKLVDCPLLVEEGRYSINWDLFENELKMGVKAIILCNPHNPIGRVWEHEELRRIAELSKKYEVFILSDEIHGDIVLSGNKYTTMGRFPEIYDKLIVYTAISKTFNMAGLISSCMMIPNSDIKDKIEGALSDAWIFGPSALAFPAIEAAYTYGDAWVDEQNIYLTENAEMVIDFIEEKMSKVKCARPEGTFLMWLDFGCFNMSSNELTKLMAEKYGIALGNGAHYGEQSDGFMRLNIGTSRKVLIEGLEKMKELYQELEGKINE
ncbi:pyridoxal phosphate-dependent aminotransferase [Clostridium malenominatum]|uniref:cysteine-S-conjugate beta-lyase n=1 Tax=Clostridium malenominatum TaxID=1539 RepID=A0ABN1IS45_9CLOT